MTFTPQLLTVINITQALPPVVTTSTNHNLSTGEVVRLVIPKNYGMQQVNNQTFIITVLTVNTFSLQSSQSPLFVNVDARNYQAFTNVGTGTPAQCNPIGSGSTPLTAPYPNVQNAIAVSTVNDALRNNSTIPIPF